MMMYNSQHIINELFSQDDSHYNPVTNNAAVVDNNYSRKGPSILNIQRRDQPFVAKNPMMAKAIMFNEDISLTATQPRERQTGVFNKLGDRNENQIQTRRTGLIHSQVYQAGPDLLSQENPPREYLISETNMFQSLADSASSISNPNPSAQFMPLIDSDLLASSQSQLSFYQHNQSSRGQGSCSNRMPVSKSRLPFNFRSPVEPPVIDTNPCPPRDFVNNQNGTSPAIASSHQSLTPTFKFKQTKPSSSLSRQLQPSASTKYSRPSPILRYSQDSSFGQHKAELYPKAESLSKIDSFVNLSPSEAGKLAVTGLSLAHDSTLSSSSTRDIMFHKKVGNKAQDSGISFNSSFDSTARTCALPPDNWQPPSIRIHDNSQIHETYPRSDTSLYPVSSLPSQFQHIFSKFSHFNHVQSEVIPDILNSDQPIVVASPTGSGKTVLFELAIVRLLQQIQNSVEDFKIVYIAPIKALCNERYQDWVRKFSPLGVKVVEITGDKEGQDVEDIKSHNLIITTPEKWDAVSRWLSLTEPQIMTSVRLLLVDEVHLLNDKARGHVLEAVVCRLKAISCPARYVAVSATFPNVEDIAFWLGGFHCVFFKFGEEVRPVKLKRVVLGFTMYEGQNEFRFEMNLSYKLEKVIADYSEGMPSLVFCNSRKSTMNTCTVLAKQFKKIAQGQRRVQLMDLASRLLDAKLKNLVVEHGVGYHHAGLVMEDRKLIEELFISGLLPVLACTSTLAMGVNLPAHLVVIKFTKQMVAGAWREYSESQILQMAGRAGRPQFCDTATVVIMTTQDRKKYYDSLIEGNTMVESNLHSHLVEHLNAEIILGTIQSVDQATDWIKSTFLYLRVRRNPTYYDKSPVMSTEQLENSMHDMCLEALQSMADVGVIIMNEDGGVRGTSLGKLMSRFYLAFSTMVQLTSLKGMESMVDMLGVICKSSELSEAVLRMTERKILNNLNRNKEKNTIRFPLQGKIKSKDMKVNVLIQASLGSMHIPDPGLNMETPRIVKLANRITTCLVEVVMNDTEKSKNYNLVKNSICLLKSLNCGIWDDSKFVVKQMDKVGPVISSALVKAGFTTFSKLSLANPRMLELHAKKTPPFGNIVRDFALCMPQYRLEVKQGDIKQNSLQVDILVSMVNKEMVKKRSEIEHDQHRWMVLVGNGNNKMVAIYRGCDTHLVSGHSVFQRSLKLPMEHWEDRLEVSLISLTISGVDVNSVLHLHLPGTKQPPAFMFRHPPSLSQFRRKCKHACVDKHACGHICCKDGVAPKSQAGSFMDNITHMRSAFRDKFNNSMAGGEGSRLKEEWDESWRTEEE